MCYTVENEDSRTIFHDLKMKKIKIKTAPFEFSEEYERDLSVSMKLRV